ncbi:hypothetical protein VOLCADRAFT_89428 [Volvox carteri f. nagariensis]|uniref:Uncharacterized protein n=1 Tax=Volvox carteri f. nagariensis TaxID=3068 RepID=D8TRN9_VOLCA|nr:uncharacterized protein VOLCADRAFT_89428 [Volvox carteri f. nagariensis]EFJ49929.1 hypothetical protein VOLCADRAFT_89428 [Volvox carteri f. nagariensis]|eukprot:XP_002948994.1 hypothetical protein VOLCADRAFT_89428 [Volvox carteri f. nagariensis]
MDVDTPTDTAADVIDQLPSPTAAIEVLRLLIAADAFPRDVAFAWFVHRQFPISYVNSTLRCCGRVVHPPREVAFTFGTSKHNAQQQQDRRHGGGGQHHGGGAGGGDGDPPETLWRLVAGEYPSWPPPASGSDFDLVAANNDWRPTLASQLAGPMSRFATLLHSWMRPHFLDAMFLDRARERYGRFLDLLAAHPERTLVPSADIALMWHTHLGLSGSYAMYGMGKGETAKTGPARAAHTNGGTGGGLAAAPIRPTYLDLEGVPLRVAYNETARLYERMYGEPYDSRDTAWLRPWELHPLAGPCSPLAFALRRAFDDVPSAAVAADAATDTGASAEGPSDLTSNGSGGPMDISGGGGLLHLSRRTSGGASGRSGVMRYSPAAAGCSARSSVPVRNRSAPQLHLQLQQQQQHPRAGAHALFAAWLVSTSAGNFFDRQTCGGLCFRNSWSIKIGTVERMVTPLVLLPYMRGLPDSSDHPFLEALSLRPGGWRPPTGGNQTAGTAAAEAETEAVEQEQDQGGVLEGGGVGEEPGGVTEVAVGVSGASCKDCVGGSQSASEQGGEGDKEIGATSGGGEWSRTLREEDEELSSSGGDGGNSGGTSGDSGGAAAGREGGGGQGGAGGWRRPTANTANTANSDGGDGSGGNDCSDVSTKRFGDDRNQQYGSTAPLWGILRRPEYVRRAQALFRHLWLELGRRGSDHPLLSETRSGRGPPPSWHGPPLQALRSLRYPGDRVIPVYRVTTWRPLLGRQPHKALASEPLNLPERPQVGGHI